MVRKDVAEKAIRRFTHEWAKDEKYVIVAGQIPDFESFKQWLEKKELSYFFEFKTAINHMYHVQLWFEDELRHWRPDAVA